MNFYILDVEVYPEWFTIGYKKYEGDRFTIRSDENTHDLVKLRNLMSNKNNVIVGYNIKGYDLPLIHSILTNFESGDSVEMLCEKAFNYSEQIVNKMVKSSFPYSMCSFTDLKDDLIIGHRLKEYESNRGLAIDETPVPFGKRNLTKEQKDLIVEYNMRDLDATEDLLTTRMQYVNSKINMAEMYNENPYELLKYTIASCGAKVLTTRQSVADNIYLSIPIKYSVDPRIRDYVYGNLPLYFIGSFTDYDKLTRSSDREKEFALFNNAVTIGLGGGHSVHTTNNASKDTVLYIEEEAGMVFLNVDVDSYYPSEAVEFGWQSRSSKDDTLYPKMLAKKRELSPLVKKGLGGEKMAREVLTVKNIINAYTGALKNEFNTLYDPQQNVNICLTGQLLLFSLANEFHIKGSGKIKIIQTNTDGIVIKFPVALSALVKNLIANWQKVTNLKFDATRIKRMWQKNVNNYILEDANGGYKNKGAWLGFKPNPLRNLSFNIINKAVFNYLTASTPLETTIRGETNPLMFMYTVKTGGGYNKTVLSTLKKNIDYGFVNRIYASVDRMNSGRLYKIKGSSRSLVPNCPEFAKVHNQAVTTIPTDIDYAYYINEARVTLNRLSRVDL